jgi:hypothetical protein
MPLQIEKDESGPYLEAEIWLCDPALERFEGVSKEPIKGCGHVMLQVTSDTQIEECPGCGEEFSFRLQEEWYVRLDIAPMDVEEPRKLRAVKGINETKPKP